MPVEVNMVNVLSLASIEVLSKTDYEWAALAERGLPLESVSELRERGLTFAEVASLVIAPRTLKHRRARGEALSREEADRLLRVSRIVALAETVFGNLDKALLWLRMADGRIGERTPLSLLQTEPGGRVVEAMIWGIDEGVYS